MSMGQGYNKDDALFDLAKALGIIIEFPEEA